MDKYSKYSLASAIALLAFAILFFLELVSNQLPPFITFFPAVTISLLLLGMAPGILTFALCFFAAWFFMPPQFSFLISIESTLNLIFFSVSNGLIFLMRWLLDHHKLKAEEHLQNYQDSLLELKMTTNQFNAILENIPAYIYQFDLDNRFVFVNAAYARLLEKTKSELIGKHISEIFPCDTASSFIENNRQIERTHKAIEFEEIATMEGELRYYTSLKAPILNGDGTFFGVLGISMDITDRKMLESTLRESDAQKQEFIAMMSHELRNPLASLVSGIQILELASHDPKLVDQTLPRIRRQIYHMKRLVNDLLDSSRISQGKLELKKTKVELNAVIEDAIDQSTSYLQSCGHLLEKQLAAQPVYLYADRDRLLQVFVNLIMNAAKFMTPGGKVRIRSWSAPPFAMVSISDDGLGIPVDKIDDIFENFYQLPEHAKITGSDGLGLGLTICRRLVELHDGKIEAFSEGENRGAEFVTTLPLPDAVERGREKSKGTEEQKPKIRVLVVDDNKDVADTLVTLLSLQGHIVKAVYYPSEVVGHLAEFNPQLVLTDISMPKMDGYELARQIRKSSAGTNIRLVALTGRGRDSDKLEAAAAGFDEHLTKPVDMEKLQKLISMAQENCPV